MEVRVNDTDEIDWTLSSTIELQITPTFSETLEAASDGSQSWSRSFQELSGEYIVDTEPGVPRDYPVPGAGLLFAVADLFRYEHRVPVEMHFACPSASGPIVKYSTAIWQDKIYYPHFESMIGEFDEEACVADESLVDCIALLSERFRNFLGDMEEVRAAFRECFEDGKGTVMSIERASAP